MIDIHSHILPGIDDGAQSLDESIEMAKAAVADGIHTIIATPHHANGKYDNPASQIEKQVAALNEELASRHIPLHVLCGQEIRVTDRFLDDYQDQISITLNKSKYILIEFSSGRIPEQINELMHELQVLGLTPIIAHPERNQEIASNPDKLRRLIKAGALAQVTSHSINGLFGSKIQSLSLDLCRRNLIHFVASDAHNMTQRAFGMRQAFNTLQSTLGSAYIDYFHQNSQLLLQNNTITIEEPIQQQKKWYHFWK